MMNGEVGGFSNNIRNHTPQNSKAIPDICNNGKKEMSGGGEWPLKESKDPPTTKFKWTFVS